MDQTRVIEVKKNILAANDEAADAFRAARAQEGTFFVDVMASPGAGKTTLLLALIRELRARGVEALGVIEADLESDVDALKIKEAGVASVELNTRGVCHVEMGMVTMAFEAFDGDRFDYLFLENIGNLVCPADFDTGAHTRVMLLSVPEGWDKVMKYPPMFAAVDALIVTKLDGTAKGGAVISIKAKLGLPVRFVGVGEGMDDLMPFDAGAFVDALFLRET